MEKPEGDNDDYKEFVEGIGVLPSSIVVLAGH